MTVYAPSGTYEPFTGQAASMLASGEETFGRWEAATNNAITLSTQALRLVFFTARKTEPITQLRTMSGATAAGATPTLCRMGVYSVDGAGAGTLVASIANDTTLWATTNTVYLRSLSATLNKVAGQRYAFGWLCVTAAAAPVIVGLTMMSSVGGAIAIEAPRLCASLSGQADLPASFIDASLASATAMGYGELVP